MSGPKPSRDLPASASKKDKERDLHEAMIGDADKTDVAGRDLAHGDGGTLGLPTKPDDLNHDD